MLLSRTTSRMFFPTGAVVVVFSPDGRIKWRVILQYDGGGENGYSNGYGKNYNNVDNG